MFAMFSVQYSHNSTTQNAASLKMFQFILSRHARRPFATTCTRTLAMATYGETIATSSVDVGKCSTNNLPSHHRGNRSTSINKSVRQKTTVSILKVESEKNWGLDPVANQYKYWNPHTSKDRGQRSYLLDMSPESIKVEAKIISLSTLDDPANAALHNPQNLPIGTTLLSVGTTLEEIQSSMSTKTSSSSKVVQPNVVFVSPSCPYAAKVLPQVLTAYPSIQWVHCRSAGIDFVESDEFVDICTNRSSDSTPLQVTNAKGQFSSSLAEYALGACTYFAKDFPRLVKQQQKKQWKNFDIEEL